MAQQSAQKLPDDDVSPEIAALRAEIERLKQEHTLELRQLEIASYKAEMELATRCRHMPTSSKLGLAKQADPHKTFFFRANGRPKKLLRLFLFAPSGQPRSLLTSHLQKEWYAPPPICHLDEELEIPELAKGLQVVALNWESVPVQI